MPSATEVILDHVEESEVARILVKMLAALLFSEGFSVERFLEEGAPYLAAFLSAAAEDMAELVSDDIIAAATAFLQELDLLGGALSEQDRAALITEALERVKAGIDDAAESIEAGFAEWVNNLRRAGMDDNAILEALLADEEGLRRILGKIETEIADTGRQFVTVIDDELYESLLQQRIDEAAAEGAEIRSHVWISVHDRNVCGRKLIGPGAIRISCWHRHGKKKAYSEWRRLGLPGSGVTLCGRRCRCRIIPMSYLKDGIPETSLKATEAIEKAQERAEKQQRRVRKFWEKRRSDYGEPAPAQ